MDDVRPRRREPDDDHSARRRADDAPNDQTRGLPEFAIDYINVSVPYPGAAPEEVEQGIVLLEEAVQGIDGVKDTSATAYEGLGQVGIRLLIGAELTASCRM